MTAGRPLKFSSVKELEDGIEAYFESCWEEVWTERNKLDDKGKSILVDGYPAKEWVQKLDREGKAILRQMNPYSVTGLAVALNTSRRTLLDYQEKAEYTHTIKKAKDICERFIEDGMLSGEIPQIAGIFNAKNNYGWVDKTETDLTASVVEMPTIKKDGKEVKFNIGPDAKTSDPIDEEEGH